MHFSFDLRLMNVFLSEHEAGRRLMNIVIEEVRGRFFGLGYRRLGMGDINNGMASK